MGIGPVLFLFIVIYFNKGEFIMDKSIDSFKEFVRNNNFLIGYIKRSNKSWQDLYELYDLYGEDEKAWNEFLKEDYNDTSNRTDNTKGNNYIEEVVKMAKNIDMDKVQEGITSLQKTLGLFGDLFVNKNNSSSREYSPRPLYRRFED